MNFVNVDVWLRVLIFLIDRFGMFLCVFGNLVRNFIFLVVIRYFVLFDLLGRKWMLFGNGGICNLILFM